MADALFQTFGMPDMGGDMGKQTVADFQKGASAQAHAEAEWDPV
jgi:hypothetical protein